MPSSSEEGRDLMIDGLKLTITGEEWLEQEEYEQRTSIGFQLERLAKTAAEMSSAQFGRAARGAIGEM